CLVGNLSQEMADQSEAFRQRLEAIFEGWRDRYAECLRRAQEAGELAAELDVDELAEFCLSSWQGAVLRAKAARSVRPIRVFINTLFGTLLRTPATGAVGVENQAVSVKPSPTGPGTW